jgi:hypothetical protein
MTVKEVSVRLTEADEKALDGSRPRRKRTRKSGGALEGAPVPPVAEKAMEPPVNPTQVIAPPEPAGVASPIVEKAMPMNFETAMPPPPPTLVQAPSGGAIKIQTRKRHQGHVGSMGIKGAVILPGKRHKLPSKDKPKLVIPIRGGAQTGSETPTPPQKIVGAETPKPQLPQTPQPLKGGKRRFTERRLSISVKALKSTRKAGKSIRKRVAAMSKEEIRKVLLEKKILKPSSNPPESMLRSMMKDYLSLAK